MTLCKPDVYTDRRTSYVSSFVRAVIWLTLFNVVVGVSLVSVTLVYAEPVTVNPKFVIERIFTSHFKPSTMAFLSADDILVLDRDEGKVFRIIDGVQSKPLLDVKVATVGYRGLLGVATSAMKKIFRKYFCIILRRIKEIVKMRAFLIP